MFITTAEVVKSECTAAQMKRYQTYSRNLTTDRDPKIFDDKMRDYLLSVAEKADLILEVNEYLDSIGYTASRYQYEQLKAQLLRFEGDVVKYRGKNPHFVSAKQGLMKEFSKLRLKPLKYKSKEDYINVCPKTDSHAGYSYIETGLKYKGEYLEAMHLTYPVEESKARQNKSWNKMILAGSRTQASGAYDEHDNMKQTNKFKAKTRLVNMVDIYQIYGELKFARPVQQSMALMPWYAGGKDDSEIHKEILNMAWNGGRWLTVDYSQYDQSIPAWLIYEAFDVVRAAFDNEGFDDELFRICVNDFIHKVFLGPDDELIESHHGIPSGSMFTQIIGSIINRLMISTYLNAKGFENYKMIIMGDDNFIITQRRIDKKNLSEYLKHNFNITMHADKGEEGIVNDGDFEFLSRRWRGDGVFREPKILISKLLFPERRREYKDLGPDVVVDAYIRSFPGGMRVILKDERLNKVRTLHEIKQLGGGKLVSGLLRYQLEYGY